MAELITQSNINNVISVNDIVLPQCAYSSGHYNNQKITVFYISDIHLHFHVDKSKNVRMQIRKIIRELISGKLEEMITRSSKFIVLFGGDVSVDTKWNEIFYYEFYVRWNYILYKKWRSYNAYALPMSQARARKIYNEELERLQNEKDIAVDKLKRWMKYDKRHQRMSTYEVIEKAKNKGLPEYIEYYIRKVKRLEDDIYRFESGKSRYIDNLKIGKRYIKNRNLPVFAVLGNHELHAFQTVNEAVDFYKELFRRVGIHFLHNECFYSEHYFRNIPWIPSEFTIIGGVGFAKYNDEYNANSVIGAEKMTREDEIKESETFYESYKKTLDEASEKNRLLVVLTHYPTKDWLPDREHDSRCVYFTGHTHRNDSVHTEKVNIYANNQIGYNKKEIKFKNAVLGTCYNPFIEYLDGTYEITTEQYMHFYDYCNDSLSGTGHIDRQLMSGNAKFYMIKQNGFYGFFVINKSTGTKICVGGRINNISKITDIHYFEESFSGVVNQYVMAMMPYRKVQEVIATEVKKLGFNGRIHGCIVDINEYNHIMINPLDGQVTYYYSPVFGYVCPYSSLRDLILSIEDYGIKERVEEKQKALVCLEENSRGKNEFLISKDSDELTAHLNQIVKVDIKNSIYKVSNRMNQLQRLFDSNILRDWNDEFAKVVVADMSLYLPQKKTSHKKLVEESVLQSNLGEIKSQNSGSNVITKGTFSDLYPDLFVDWDFEKNNINPAVIPPGAKVMVNWKCNKCNYEWEARVDKRCTGRSICKQCKWRVIERDARLRKK